VKFEVHSDYYNLAKNDHKITFMEKEVISDILEFSKILSYSFITPKTNDQIFEEEGFTQIRIIEKKEKNLDSYK
jgi:hypothetical protein